MPIPGFPDNRRAWDLIRYARCQGRTRLLDYGRVEIDSNVAERAIRPIALNHKNAFFAGSDGGGEHWAVILPWAYTPQPLKAVA
jgi:hypothetical protein